MQYTVHLCLGVRDPASRYRCSVRVVLCAEPTYPSIYLSIRRYSKDADDIPAWSQQGECIPPICDLPIPSVNAVLYRRAPTSPASPLAAGHGSFAAGHAGSSAHGHGSFAAARPAALNALLGAERRQASLPSHMSSLG